MRPPIHFSLTIKSNAVVDATVSRLQTRSNYIKAARDPSHTRVDLSDGQTFAISISEDFVTSEPEIGSESPKTGPLERDNPSSKLLICIEGPKYDLKAGIAPSLFVSLLAIYHRGATIPSIFLGGQEL